MEEEILEKANELYDLLSKAKEEIEIGNSNQHWVMIETQTALGSAQMIFNRGETTVQTLIDNVATKGGCTFVGICEMKEGHSDKLFYDVIDKTTQKANALGK